MTAIGLTAFPPFKLLNIQFNYTKSKNKSQKMLEEKLTRYLSLISLSGGIKKYIIELKWKDSGLVS